MPIKSPVLILKKMIAWGKYFIQSIYKTVKLNALFIFTQMGMYGVNFDSPAKTNTDYAY
jgi:hypothetical protein